MKHHIMKFGALGFAGWLSIALLLPSIAQADTTVDGTTVPVTATVTGINTLSAQPKNITGNANATTIAYGTIPTSPGLWNTKAQQYIEVSVADNAPSWRLRAMTNNFTSQPSTTTWGFAYGGLVGSPGAKAPMAWLNNPTLIASGPATGNPSTGTVNGWTFIKDLRDVDDPGTAGTNESFASADTGYTNIAFGAPSFTRINRPNVFGGSEELAATSTPWFFYLEADFSASPASSYSSKLVLELLNQ